ncbi:Short-chain dehydrogenase/reductase SDR [Candidatus Nanopelagicaceae bacterium]
MSDRVKDRIAIVTGAGSGIGQASAIRLAEEGAKVICADINLESATKPAPHLLTMLLRNMALSISW